MTELVFGKKIRMDLREIWPNEATDFTPWLSQNIKSLGEALGMDLELLRPEAPVGDFSLDILARDLGRNKHVIIENQLETTDHDHLGKLLTYAAGYDAGAIIWIAKEIREEHRQVIDWLNLHTEIGVEFFAVTIEVFKIDESNPTYEFKPLAFPNDWRKARIRAAEPGETSERYETYREYFQKFIDKLREEHQFTNARRGQPQSWYSFASSVNGAFYGHSFARGNRIRTEVYIDSGDVDLNKNVFDHLQNLRESIESEFGEQLIWERLDNRRASRIGVYREGNIGDRKETLEEISSWAIDRLLQFKRVFGDRLQEAFEQYQESNNQPSRVGTIRGLCSGFAKLGQMRTSAAH